jgi:hypothetical protein
MMANQNMRDIGTLPLEDQTRIIRFAYKRLSRDDGVEFTTDYTDHTDGESHTARQSPGFVDTVRW